MLSLSDLQHLESAQAWLERGDYCKCFEELRSIADGSDVRVQALRWRLYHSAGMQAAAAKAALDMQHQHPKEFVSNIWRSLSLQNGLAPFLLALSAW